MPRPAPAVVWLRRVAGGTPEIVWKLAPLYISPSRRYAASRDAAVHSFSARSCAIEPGKEPHKRHAVTFVRPSDPGQLPTSDLQALSATIRSGPKSGAGQPRTISRRNLLAVARSTRTLVPVKSLSAPESSSGSPMLTELSEVRAILTSGVSLPFAMEQPCCTVDTQRGAGKSNGSHFEVSPSDVEQP